MSAGSMIKEWKLNVNCSPKFEHAETLGVTWTGGSRVSLPKFFRLNLTGGKSKDEISNKKKRGQSMSGRWKRTQNTHDSNQWPTRAQKSSNFEATGPEDGTRRHLSIAKKHFQQI